MSRDTLAQPLAGPEHDGVSAGERLDESYEALVDQGPIGHRPLRVGMCDAPTPGR
jgi:hypothetical protein